MILSANSQAPDFTLPDESGEEHSLSDYKGKIVVLYFYPKDNTPGCTTEACNFRDDYSAYKNANVVILGVSPDSPRKHTNFKTKYELPFTLLADENHEVCKLYGVWGTKKSFGRTYEGVYRTTFLIDEQGKIAKVFEKVKPAKHSEEVLASIAEIRKNA